MAGSSKKSEKSEREEPTALLGKVIKTTLPDEDDNVNEHVEKIEDRAEWTKDTGRKSTKERRKSSAEKVSQEQPKSEKQEEPPRRKSEKPQQEPPPPQKKKASGLMKNGVVSESVMIGLQVQRRHKLITDFGYKESDGITTSTAKGDEKREKAIKEADDWFFAELGRRTAQAQELLDVRAFYFACRKDFGWKSSYGALTNSDKSDALRKEAHRKAMKYVCVKFGCKPSEIETWCF